MARNYGQYSGFSEGFQSGFGLVSDVMDRQAKNRLAARQMEMEEEDARRTADYRLQVLDNQAAEKAAQDQFRQTSLEKQTADSKAQAALRQKQLESQKAITAAAKFELDKKQKVQGEVEAANMLTQLDNVIQTQGLVDDELIKQVVESTKGTVFDVTKNFSADMLLVNDRTKQALTGLQQGQAPDNQVVQGVMKSLFDHSVRQGSNEGQIVSEVDRYAPEDFKDGTWTKIGFEFDRGEYVTNPDDPSKTGFTGRMQVKVRNSVDGRESMYFAPITKGARPDAEPIIMHQADILRTEMGRYFTSQQLQKYRPIIENAIKRKRFGSEAKYLEAKGDLLADLQKNADEFPNAPSPIQGLTNAEFKTHKGGALLENYVDDILLRDRSTTSYQSDKQRLIAALMQDKKVRALAEAYRKETGETLNEDQLLRLDAMLGSKDFLRKAQEYLGIRQKPKPSLELEPSYVPIRDR